MVDIVESVDIEFGGQTTAFSGQNGGFSGQIIVFSRQNLLFNRHGDSSWYHLQLFTHELLLNHVKNLATLCSKVPKFNYLPSVLLFHQLVT